MWHNVTDCVIRSLFVNTIIIIIIITLIRCHGVNHFLNYVTQSPTFITTFDLNFTIFQANLIIGVLIILLISIDPISVGRNGNNLVKWCTMVRRPGHSGHELWCDRNNYLCYKLLWQLSHHHQLLQNCNLHQIHLRHLSIQVMTLASLTSIICILYFIFIGNGQRGCENCDFIMMRIPAWLGVGYLKFIKYHPPQFKSHQNL